MWRLSRLKWYLVRGRNTREKAGSNPTFPCPVVLCNRIQWNLRGEGGGGEVTTLTAKVTIFGV